MNGIWKYIATGALSMLLTLAGAYWTANAQAVTKEEMHQAIASDHDLMKETHDDVKVMKDKIEQLDREIGEIRGLLRDRIR
jgi:hypothetical protein